MLISELIERLQEIRNQRGDLPVHVYDEWDHFPIGLVAYATSVSEAGFFVEECVVLQTEENPYSSEEA